MKSIQTKLITVILTTFLVSLGILGILSYYRASSILTDDINNLLEKQAEKYSSDINAWITKERSTLIGLTAVEAIQRGDTAAIPDLLEKFVKENNVFPVACYIDQNGIMINSAHITADLSNRDYVKQTLQGQSTVAGPYESKENPGTLILNVTTPVKTNGKVTGGLFGQVQMNEASDIVKQVKIGETGYGYIVKNDGEAVAHPDGAQVGKLNILKDSAGELAEVYKEAVKGERGIRYVEKDGIEQIIAFEPIDGLPWSLIIEVPANEVMGVLGTFRWSSLILVVIMMVIATIITVTFARSIARPIQELDATVDKVAAGDLRKMQLTINSNDEIGRLGGSFQTMTENLRNLIQRIQNATTEVSESAEAMTTSSGQSAQAAQSTAVAITHVAEGTAEQMTATENADTLVNQLTKDMAQLARSAEESVQHTKAAAAEAQSGGDTVKQAVSQMKNIESTVLNSAESVRKLGERSEEIGQIVDVISGIAGQTSLLSLNAAIEAARAGEQGRGFAVVADEVRKLAEQSQEAAEKITALIQEIQVETQGAVEAMNSGTLEVKEGSKAVTDAGEAFLRIATLVENISEGEITMAGALQQMEASSGQVAKNIETVSTLAKKSASEAETVSAAAQEQSASMNEIVTASQNLLKLSQTLSEAVAGFKVR
ncbi:methyl-accepting chemotaxis protein [Anaerovibrio sp.]|uniref:methyl-accepting chemotaxis protein n=1 Tax=Anaerovibrio sp. TaxID=1872532 RepID=UPI0025C6E315|nr:methyl-accepting chemotaxis protein [Anaerovibrio sp.]MBR2142505.1 methyl-accepting chemotaxis protein [Anaerovibrio sp.]